MKESMQALVYEGAWQMPLRDVPMPIPSADEVVVRVETVGVCGSDVHGYKGTTGRRKPPIIMGHEFAGIVSALGESVLEYHLGDRVVVNPLLSCGICDNCRSGFPNQCQNRSVLGVNLNGAYAQYVKVMQKMVFPLPAEMSWEQGALVEPLAVAMHAVNLIPLKLLDTVIVLGGGTIGLLTMLAARLKGAGKIIVIDPSAHRLEFARRLGADDVINPANEDAVEAVKKQTRGKGAPAVIEAVGITATAKQSLFMAHNGANIVWIGNSDPDVIINMQDIVTRELTVRGAYGFNDEFILSIEAIRSRRVDPTILIEKRAHLADGTQLIDDLARGKAEWLKVVLIP
jgi:L-iditol 2-dehydrogenase